MPAILLEESTTFPFPMIGELKIKGWSSFGKIYPTISTFPDLQADYSAEHGTILPKSNLQAEFPTNFHRTFPKSSIFVFPNLFLQERSSSLTDISFLFLS